VFACFDNEEVGSRTINGADSTFLDDVLREINSFLGVNKYGYALSNSFIVSCDNAHSFHPNYQGQYDPTNRVHINEGIAIKYNANGSYTTSGISSAVFKSILDSANVKYQEFTNRSDSRGGGTLGSISLSHVSINSVDIGLPQYAMHSAYETCGVKDAYELVSGMTKFYGSKILINKKDNKIVIK
jgi:aspartyl aminopeptidase